MDYIPVMLASDPINSLMGLLKAVWGILALLVTLVKALMLLGGVSTSALWDAACSLLNTICGWSVNLLLANPLDILGGLTETQVSTGGTAESAVNNWFGLHSLKAGTGMGTVMIEAGLALTLIAFFYGFSESTVQLEKTNIQLIFSRILRWVIAIGLVTVCYQLIGYLFLAFRSLYGYLGYLSSKGGGTPKTFFENNLGSVFTHSWGLTSDTDLFDWDTAFGASDFSGDITDFGAVTSLRASIVGTVVMLLGVLKLFKKLIKYVIELIPNLLRVIVLFVCAPLGIAMYASPETQQKANSYFRTFAAAVLSNLLKVMAIGFVTVLAVSFSVTGNGGGTLKLLDTYGIAADILNAAIPSGGDLNTDIAFFMTSGGLLGMHLFIDLLTKTCDVSERFAQEVMA